MDEKSLNELLECSVCLDRLDHTSKVLPCQHTFCRRCLEEILSTKRELRCPECRTVVTIRVDDLPPNILLIRLLEGIKTQGHLLGQKSDGQQFTQQGVDVPIDKVPTTSIQLQTQPRQVSQPCAKALFNYEAKESGDLSFKKNDIVILRKQIDENWYHGELNGQHGFFPATYVQVLVPLPQVPQCQALFDFDLKDEKEKDCLAFQKDEKLTVIRKVDDNWIEGRKGDKIGIFPITFVKLNEAAKSLLNSQSNIGLIQPNNQPVASSVDRNQRVDGQRVPPAPSSSSTTLPSNSVLLASRTAQQKRHSFTLTPEKTPSPTGQSQRRSLELNSSGAFSIVGTSSPSASPVMTSKNNAPSSVVTSSSQKPVSAQPVTLPDLLTGNAAGTENNTVVSSSLTTPVYMAMYNYKPQKEDEVELRKGDYYTVTEKCQDGWFKGQCLRSGNIGVYPGNYVQMIRHSSAFKPVNPNVLNIRAKGPLSPPPTLTAITTSNTQPTVVQSTSDNVSSNASSQLTSSCQAPPLLPRSSKTRTASPSSPATKSSKSSSSLHGGSASSRLQAPLTSSSIASTKSSASHSHSKNSHTHSAGSGHVSRRSNHHSGGGVVTSSPGGGPVWSAANLAAVQHSMSTTSNITPPNVVLGAPGDNVSSHSKEKKEKKDKEKKSLVKLLAGKSKKSKSPGGEIDALTEASAGHVRSGSYPSDAGAGALCDSPHKKTGSFDSSSSPPQSAKPIRPKPLIREKYRCIVPYPPHSEHELELQMGDLVYVHKKREDGWFKGTLARNGRTGLFPGSFVEKME